VALLYRTFLDWGTADSERLFADRKSEAGAPAPGEGGK